MYPMEMYGLKFVYIDTRKREENKKEETRKTQLIVEILPIKTYGNYINVCYITVAFHLDAFTILLFSTHFISVRSLLCV